MYIKFIPIDTCVFMYIILYASYVCMITHVCIYIVLRLSLIANMSIAVVQICICVICIRVCVFMCVCSPCVGAFFAKIDVSRFAQFGEMLIPKGLPVWVPRLYIHV